MLGLLWRDVQRLPSPPLPPSSWRGHSKKRNSGRRWRNRASVWILLAIILLLVLPLSACVTLTSSASIVGAGASTVGAYFDYLTSEKGEAVIVTPPLVDYTSEIQTRAADEFEQLGPPCARDHLTENCSAAARFIMDYGTLRDKIRAAKN
tara:strand:- start:268 stop:717 length:450 start_codon:yes stop_codon:yes gene_type:complete